MTATAIRRTKPGLRELRKKRGMSQDELGFRADIAQSRLSRVERGYATLSNGERERVAVALGVKAEDLSQVVNSS